MELNSDSDSLNIQRLWGWFAQRHL